MLRFIVREFPPACIRAQSGGKSEICPLKSTGNIDLPLLQRNQTENIQNLELSTLLLLVEVTMGMAGKYSETLQRIFQKRSNLFGPHVQKLKFSLIGL